MKIAIATVQVPFLYGGAEFHAQNLRRALIAAGHEAEIVTMPLVESPPHLITNHILAARLMDLNQSGAGRIDLCIGLKFPAYCIPHDNKVVWMLHQTRVAYDLYGTPYSELHLTEQGRAVREAVVQADNHYLPEARRVYTNSKNVAKRLLRYNGLLGTPLYHPCPEMDHFYCDEDRGYFLVPSRISSTKRQSLIVQALSHCREDVRLILIGRPDHPIVGERLMQQVEELHLSDRVTFLNFVSTEEKLRLYAQARAVLFCPLDEDYGYITLEAMAAHKAVLTCTDSGGPLEFVLDGQTGMVSPPTPQDLARAMDTLWASPALCKQMGEAAHARLLEMDITWEHVVKELLKP